MGTARSMGERLGALKDAVDVVVHAAVPVPASWTTLKRGRWVELPSPRIEAETRTNFIRGRAIDNCLRIVEYQGGYDDNWPANWTGRINASPSSCRSCFHEVAPLPLAWLLL